VNESLARDLPPWWPGRGRVLLFIVLAVGLALRVSLAFRDDGLFWPDEIYQSLEPAHWLAFGYGLLPWEYVDGARSWALPALIAAALKLFDLGQLHDPRSYVLALRLVFCAVGVATAAASYRLARAFGASPLAAAVGAAFFALVFPAVYFAPRALSETACALPATLGFALAAAPQGEGRGRRRDRILGGSLLGLAVLLRLHAAVFCVGALATLGARRSWRPLLEVSSVLAGWAILVGLLDRLTWGSWFHSARVYLDFNLLSHGAERFGTEPFLFYARVLWTICPAALVLFGFLALCAVKRAPGVFFSAAAFFILHCWSGHKEIRFILPVLPFFGALAGVGLTELAELAPWSAVAAGALALLSLLPAARSRGRTFADLGQGFAPASAAVDFGGPVNRLLFAAHRLPDLCGLKVESTHLAWTGGFSYLHRKVPLYYSYGPGRPSGLFNYAIANSSQAGTGTVVARDGDQALVRLGDGCVPDPGYWVDFRKRRVQGVRDPAPYVRPW
jgi:GPI mannosyltransferase 3